MHRSQPEKDGILGDTQVCVRVQNENPQLFHYWSVRVNLEYCLLLFFITVTQLRMMFYDKLASNLFLDFFFDKFGNMNTANS